MIIFKDLIHYCQVGRGYQQEHFIVVCSVKTMKQKTTRADIREDLASCWPIGGGGGGGARKQAAPPTGELHVSIFNRTLADEAAGHPAATAGRRVKDESFLPVRKANGSFPIFIFTAQQENNHIINIYRFILGILMLIFTGEQSKKFHF